MCWCHCWCCSCRCRCCCCSCPLDWGSRQRNSSASSCGPAAAAAEHRRSGAQRFSAARGRNGTRGRVSSSAAAAIWVGRSVDAPVDRRASVHRVAPLHRHPVETSRSFLAAVAGRRHCTATTRIRADEGGGPASSPVCSPRTLPPSLAPAINRHVCLTVVAPYRLSCAGCGMLWCVCPVFLSLFSSLLSSPPFFPPTPLCAVR